MSMNKSTPGGAMAFGRVNTYVPPHMRSPKFLSVSTVNTSPRQSPFAYPTKTIEPMSPKSPRKLVSATYR
jgi:hypothetical protein